MKSYFCESKVVWRALWAVEMLTTKCDFWKTRIQRGNPWETSTKRLVGSNFSIILNVANSNSMSHRPWHPKRSAEWSACNLPIRLPSSLNSTKDPIQWMVFRFSFRKISMVNLVSQKEFISVFNSKTLIDNGPIRRSNLKSFRKTIKPFKTSKTMLLIAVRSCKEQPNIGDDEHYFYDGRALY